jgi:hypothetical protein
MKEEVFVLLILMISILLGILTGFRLNQNISLEENQSESKIVSFTTDKDSYLEGDSIEMVLVVYSPSNKEAYVNVSGIKSRYGYYISIGRNVNLTTGENALRFSSRVPYCSSCTGVDPGKHTIIASIIQNDKTVATASKDIKIERR